jgi:tRNA/tmRNA/rRNA uracil-C5-methylase (TrmA/RlmC/RlmD family)
MNDPRQERLHAGDRVRVEVDRLLPSGEGAAGRLRIAGAFPGERVIARVEHIGKHASFATLVEVERPRRGRRVPPCARHADLEGGRCTGCALMPLDESEQRTLLKEMLQDRFGLEVTEVIAAPKAFGYRRSAKRIAFGGPGNLRLGSFIRGTHQPADMSGCEVEHPAIAGAADEIAERARQLGIGAHNEERQQLGLRAVWLRTNGQQVLATLVTSDPDEAPLRTLAEQLRKCHGVARSFHGDSGNALRGSEATILHGIGSIDVGDATVGPLGFLQPNPEMMERLYDDLIDGAVEDDHHDRRVFDLYAGAGATTARLRALGVRVTACESHPEGASKLGVVPETVETFLARQTSAPDAVIANPPRKGLGSAVTAELLRLRPARIQIMSCGPSGLAKDLSALSSRYHLETLRAYDTLPQTPHVELIAKLVLRFSFDEADATIPSSEAP